MLKSNLGCLIVYENWYTNEASNINYFLIYLSFLKATIASDQLGLLTTRLAGLSSERAIFCDLEEVFAVPVLNAASNPIASATGIVPNVSVRVRKSMLSQSKEAGVLPILRYLGSVESEKAVSALILLATLTTSVPNLL